MKIDIKVFTKDYLETAAWVTVEVGENEEFTEEAKGQAEDDCLKFIQAVRKEFGAEKGMELLNTSANDLTYLAPHDFFLTRNGHGTGFWDKPEFYGGQENADRLTKICDEIGSVDCYHVKGKKSKLTF
jgi:hypothetical protein